MKIIFVSHSVIDFYIDKITGKAIGKVLIYYRRDDAPAYLEHDYVNVSYTFPKEEPKWEVRYNIITAAKKKLLQLEATFPRLITNIFIV